jgi:hypothetical protein
MDNEPAYDYQQEIDELFNHEIGFSKIIEKIINSKKIVVGHNMLFDVCFIYN